MVTQYTNSCCGKNDLDRRLDQVLQVVAELVQDGVIGLYVLDFDADHVGLMSRGEPGRMRFFSAIGLLAQTRIAPARDAAETRDLPCALANIADLRRRRERPLHQASVDLERGWATLRFLDGRVRTVPLECPPTAGHPGHRLAS